MKVAKIIPYLDFGGVESILLTIAKYFKGNKQDLVFIVIAHGGAISGLIKELGYPVYILNSSCSIPSFKSILKIYHLLQKIKPDVIHTCGGQASFHGLIAGAFAKVPVKIAGEFGMPSHSKKANVVFAMVYSLSRAVVADAKRVAAYLINTKEVPEKKVKVIYTPVDVNRYAGITKTYGSKQTFTLLAISRLHPRKKIDSVIHIINELKNENIILSFDIVGEGPDKERLQKLVELLQLSQQVTFHGFHSNPANFHCSADAFILASNNEGHSISVLEAMLAGTPVICTGNGGPSEIIKTGINGFLINPDNLQSIKEAILTLFNMQPEERKKIADSAQQLVLNNFTPDIYINQLYNLYKKYC